MLCAGALVGAALGATELAWTIGLAPEPSVGRRGVALLVATGCWHALAGATAAALGLVLGRARPERESAIPLACLVCALALAWLGELTIGGRVLGELGRRWRYGALLVLFVAWVALAGAIGAALRARAARRVPAARANGLRRLTVAALVLLVASASFVVVVSFRARQPEDLVKVMTSPGARPHLLLVVVDTLRADALSCYGAPAGSTPNIDRLAARGVLFEDVLSTSSWTIPAVATIFTGQPPALHGVGEFSGRMRAEDATLFEELGAAGYDCTAIVGNPLVAARTGFTRGFRLFDSWDYALECELALQRAGWELARLCGLVRFPRRLNPVLRPTFAFPFVDTRPQRSPLDEDLAVALARFAPPRREVLGATFLQLVGPHDPYLERPPTFRKERLPLLRANVVRLRELYAGEVANTDRVLGEVLASYERAGILADTLVVVTSDHGEEFLEHGGLQHGHTLFDEVLRVPLVIAGPGVASGRRLAERVSLGDLTATLYELLGVPAPSTCLGTSLAPLVGPQARGVSLPPRVFAELTSQILNADRRCYSVVEGPWKIVREHGPAGALRELVFDLARDPLEREPLAALPPELDELRRALVEYEALAVRAEQGALDEDARRDMQALGYLGDE